MATFEQVLCAVDFSPSSRGAMTFAAELARRYGARLTLLHAYEPPPAASGDMFVGPVEVFSASVRAAERRLAGWRVDAERAALSDVAAAVAIGRAADAIVRFAEEHRSDLIVVASMGRSALRRLLDPSVADEVLRKATCPVLVISRDAESAVRPTPLYPRRGLHLVDAAAHRTLPRR
ncbi:MAG: universal stress protein [Anaeromyxobacteraceae bacterium]